MVDFLALTRAQAQAYLQQFLDEMPSSRARFEELLQECGAATGLDCSPASLDHVWAAVRTLLAWQPGYQPPALGMPGPDGDPEKLGPMDELPSWFTHPSNVGLSSFSRETLWIIDGLSRHLAQVVLAAVPGAHWIVGNSRRKGYVHQNQPVITGLGDDFNPVRTTANLVTSSLRGLTHGPRSLRDLYDAWVPH